MKGPGRFVSVKPGPSHWRRSKQRSRGSGSMRYRREPLEAGKQRAVVHAIEDKHLDRFGKRPYIPSGISQENGSNAWDRGTRRRGLVERVEL